MIAWLAVLSMDDTPLTPSISKSWKLSDPYRLVEAKEAIAARHCCRPIERRPVAPVRSLHPVSISTGYDPYWRKAITAAMS